MEDQIIKEANDKLLKNREKHKAMVRNTQLMQSSEDNAFINELNKITLVIEDKIKEEDKCEHGVLKSDYCWECREIESHKEYVEREKDKLRESLNNLNPILQHCGVAKKYFNTSFDSFKGNDKLVKECREYKGDIGLVLSGNTGCGKTHLAISIMRQYIIDNINELINIKWKHNFYHDYPRPYFITVPDLLLEIRNSFKENPKESESEIIDTYSEIGFLVLDDLGSEKSSEYAITTLYIIIDRRDRQMKNTIITTNLTLDEIDEKLDARIASRLAGMKNIKIKMPDYRKKR